MDYTKLKEEIKAGKYLPEHNTALPQLPENANEEAIRINNQYKQHIKRLELRIKTLEEQNTRLDMQNNLNIQWQAEIEKRDQELEYLNHDLRVCQQYNVYRTAQLKDKDNTIDLLKKELESAKELATETAQGQKKKLTEKIAQLEIELAESKNTNQVEWDVLMEAAKEYSKDDVSKIIAPYIMNVIVHAKISSPELSNSLFTKATNLSREVEEKKQQNTTTINVSGDYNMNKNVENEVGNVEPNATGIAVNNQN